MERFAIALAKFAAPKYLWIAFGVELLFAAIVSVILVYHWTSYTIDNRKVRRIKTIYFSGIGAFLLTEVLALVFYSI